MGLIPLRLDHGPVSSASEYLMKQKLFHSSGGVPKIRKIGFLSNSNFSLGVDFVLPLSTLGHTCHIWQFYGHFSEL